MRGIILPLATKPLKSGGLMRPAHWFTAAVFSVGLLTLWNGAIHAQAPRPSTARGEWPTYGGDLGSSKYSPLDQITKDNFSSLRVAWRAPSPDAVLSMTLPGGGELMSDGRTIFDELKRLDPK